MADKKEDRLSEWLQYWDDGSMFEMHAHKPHPKIVEHYDKIINGKTKAKLFFPLCGDVVDMIMMAEKGHHIVGVECSELGVKTFFTQNKIEYKCDTCDQVKGKLFQSKDGRIKIYCCDMFDFSESVEGQFDAILDFGSMGAIYKRDLQKYADLMKNLMKPDCRHFLECFVYDLEKYPDRLPNCFTVESLRGFYGDKCNVVKLEEGPNPYEECEANVTDQSFSGSTLASGSADKDGGQKKEKEKEFDGEEFPEITGAAYFMITPNLS